MAHWHTYLSEKHRREWRDNQSKELLEYSPSTNTSEMDSHGVRDIWKTIKKKFEINKRV